MCNEADAVRVAEGLPKRGVALVPVPVADMAQRFVAVLRRIFEEDAAAAYALVFNRVPCNGSVAARTSAEVDTVPVDNSDKRPPRYAVGLLGVLNGILLDLGSTERVASVCYKADDGSRVLKGFAVVPCPPIVCSQPTREAVGTAIRTLSGRYLDLAAPSPDDIVLSDVANGLGKECRFGRQLSAHYSVAEHSVHMAAIAERAGMSRLVQLACLLHDAPEAYIGDAARPFKQMLGDAYTAIEERLFDAIWAKLGARHVDGDSRPLKEILRHVKRIDDAIMHHERLSLMGDDGVRWVGHPEDVFLKLCPRLVCWGHATAADQWLQAYQKIVSDWVRDD